MCVPPTSVAATRCWYREVSAYGSGRGCGGEGACLWFWRECLPLGLGVSAAVFRRYLPQVSEVGVPYPPFTTHPLVGNSMHPPVGTNPLWTTDTCENFTLPQTSFVGGQNMKTCQAQKLLLKVQDWSGSHFEFLTPVLMHKPTLGVNGAINTSVFLPSVNSSINKKANRVFRNAQE